MASLRVRDAADRLNVSEKTVYKWLRTGLLPANRIGKKWVITEESVEALLNPFRDQTTQTRSQSLASRSNENSRSASTQHLDSSFSTNRSALQSAMTQLSEVSKGAVEHGISGILGPRRLDPSTPQVVARALESSEGEVLLQGVGLREFFGDKDYASILRKMATEDRPVSVRAILVDPMGQFARARTVAQDGEQFADDALFRAGPLFGDSWRSLNVIGALKNASESSKNFRLDVRFVDHWPSTYFVLTDECAFVETYHFGRVDSVIDTSTIDGLVPMLRVVTGSDYYNLLRNHFDYLWSAKNPFVPVKTLEQVLESVQIQL